MPPSGSIFQRECVSSGAAKATGTITASSHAAVFRIILNSYELSRPKAITKYCAAPRPRSAIHAFVEDDIGPRAWPQLRGAAIDGYLEGPLLNHYHLFVYMMVRRMRCLTGSSIMCISIRKPIVPHSPLGKVS